MFDSMRTWQRMVLVFAVILGCSLRSTLSAQSAFNWRYFGATEGLTNSVIASVNISSRGNVWITHEGVNAITKLDGLGQTTIPHRVYRSNRVYESQVGQLWIVSEDGLELYSDGRWQRHPIDEVRREHTTQMGRVRIPITLIPLRINQVLILLSDSLLRYDAKLRKIETLLFVDDTGLASFGEMIELQQHNDSVLIAGQNGLLLLPPARQIAGDFAFREFLVDPAANLQRLRGPVENDDGSITLVGDGPDGNRHIVEFSNQEWGRLISIRVKANRAWRGENNMLWAQSYRELVRIRAGVEEPVGTDEVTSGLFRDSAVDSNGIFWLATNEGLIRHQPLYWQAPQALRDIDSTVAAMHRDRAGRLWFVTSQWLVMLDENEWRRYVWPDPTEVELNLSNEVYELRDGRLAFNGSEGPLLFNPLLERFSRFEAQELRTTKILGQNLNDDLIVLLEWEDPTKPGKLLRLFDGEKFEPLPVFDQPWQEPGELNFVVETPNREFWFGDDRGIGVIQNPIYRFGPQDGFFGERVSAFHEFKDGRIWCGASSHLFEYDGRRWERIYLAGDRINAIFEAVDGSVWVSSSSGLHRLQNESWVVISTSEGLQSSAVYAVMQDHRNRMWVATARGVSLHHPEVDKSPPRTQIIVAPSEGGRTRGNAISVGFNARDHWNHTPPERLLYSYRMNKDRWAPFEESNTTWTFEDLPAGKHRLWVKAMDRNWNEEIEPAYYDFVSVIPWHQDPRLLAFSIISFGVICLLTAVAYNSHLRLKRSYAEVEKIVALRTSELNEANRELLHSQKMNALGTLAAGIAHDFNSILSIIKGSVQIIQENPSNVTKVNTRLQRIRMVVDQGAGIVRAMLGLSRHGADRDTRLDLVKLAGECADVMSDRVKDEVTIEVAADENLPPAIISADLMQQTLVNLITNAADSIADSGAVTLSISRLMMLPDHPVLKPAEASEYVRIAVRDTGSGISAENLSRVFEPFFTTKSFSSRRGTGLGLSMVYEMVREMKCGLTVESFPGEGSTFAIIIPISKADEAESGPEGRTPVGVAKN